MDDQTESGVQPTPTKEFTWCWLGLHDWTIWNDIQRGQLLDCGKVVGYYLRQERRCIHCNIAQLHDHKTAY